MTSAPRPAAFATVLLPLLLAPLCPAAQEEAPSGLRPLHHVLPGMARPPQEQEGPPPRMAVEGDRVHIETPPGMGFPLPEFVQQASRIARTPVHVNWMENPTAKQDFVHFTTPMEVPREEFFSFVQSVLYCKNYAFVPRGEGASRFFELVFMAGPRRMEVRRAAQWVPPEELGRYRHQAGTYILTAIPLRHVEAARAVTTLRPILGPDTMFDSLVPLGSALMVSGFGPSVYAISRLLELVDVPPPPGPPRAAAAEGGLAETLSRVLRERGAGRIVVLVVDPEGGQEEDGVGKD